MASAWSAAVTTRVRSRPNTDQARRKVAPRSDSLPPPVRSCLGRARLLAGHSRVPPPPARISAYASSVIGPTLSGLSGFQEVEASRLASCLGRWDGGATGKAYRVLGGELQGGR